MKASKTGAYGNHKPLASALHSAILLSLLVLSTHSASAQKETLGSLAQGESSLAAQVRTLNNNILQLHGQLQDNPSSAVAIRSQGAVVIAKRAAALTTLIQQDPRAALSFAFSPELLADLAQKFPQSASLLESHRTVSGPVERWTADYPSPKTSRSWLTMRLGARSLNLHFAYQEPRNLRGGDVVQASGVLVESAMAVETSSIVQSATASISTSAPRFAGTLDETNFPDDQSRPVFVLSLCLVVLTTLRGWAASRPFRKKIRRYAFCTIAISLLVFNPNTASAQTTTCSTKGVQNTAVILVTFSGVALPTGVTAQSLYDAFFGTSTGVSLDGYLRDASYGQAFATGNVFGPYTLTGTYSTCTDVGGAVLNDAIAAAVAGGANLSNYSRIFLVFPDIFNCGWAGFASNSCGISSSSGSFNASVAYLAARYVVNRAYTVSLASHEIGHNLGLLHSGIITAGTDALGPVSSPGTMYDQNGDYWSTMGEIVLGTYPAPQKAEVLGWMAPSNNYATVQSSGTYTLQALETSPPGFQALKIQRGTGNNAWLWVEFRQPIDSYDSTLSAQPFSGALIHYEDPSTQTGHTYLPNFTPTDTTWNSPALAVGKTWNDPYSNVSITALSASSAGLTVSVNYGATPCTSSAPSVAVSPLNPSIYPGQSASYSVAVTNNDSTGCSSSTINLGSTEPSGWSTSLSSSSLTLNPGQSASVTLAKGAPSGTPTGTYAVNLNASNNAATGAGTANATVVTPPTLAVSISVSGTSFTRPGTVPITASVTSSGAPASGASVTFTVTTTTGAKVTQSATTGSQGTATWSYKLGPKAPTGTYSVTAQSTLTSSGAASAQAATSNTITFSVH